MQFKKLFGVFNITTANVVDTFLSVIISKDMELDALADVYSKKLDGIIIDQKRKGLRNDVAKINHSRNHL